MESPFYSIANKHTNVVYIEPVLNTYYKTYMNILTVNGMPSGPLSEMVYSMRFDKLSPFQYLPITSSSSGFPQCTMVIGKYRTKPVMNNASTFMGIDDIPALFSYLELNGYTIDRSLTRMLLDSNINLGSTSTYTYSGNRQMVCMFSYTQH